MNEVRTPSEVVIDALRDPDAPRCAELEQMLTERIAQVSGQQLLAELERRAVPAGAVRTVGEALRQPNAQPRLLPPAPGFLHAGLRTVAFHASAWETATELTPPPALGQLSAADIA